MAYLTDNELNPPGAFVTAPHALATFARGVGLLIHDAQYTEAEMPAKRGWGHSLVSEVLELGHLAEAATVALFHHEPERDDEALDRIGVAASDWLKQKNSKTEALVAREGLTVRVVAR
jgi:ribonuclease BN (tRNA processing enzyme)